MNQGDKKWRQTEKRIVSLVSENTTASGLLLIIETILILIVILNLSMLEDGADEGEGDEGDEVADGVIHHLRVFSLNDLAHC